MSLITIGSAVGGLVGGFLIKWLLEKDMERKMKGLSEIKEAVRKKKKLFLLETDNAFWIGGEKASFQNISITKGRNLVLVGPNSIKPVFGLGGVLLGVGDLYRATTIPRELRQTIVFLKVIGFSDKEIKTYLSKIHGQGVVKKSGVAEASAVKSAEEYLIERLDEKIKNLESMKEKLEEKGKQTEAKKIGDKIELLKLIRENKQIYITTPSTIVNYLQTGINRVTLKAQLKQIIDEKKLEQLGQINWISIGIMIFLILLGLWLFMGGGVHGIIDLFKTHATIIPPR